MSSLIWFQLVDSAGKPYKNNTVSAVSLNHGPLFIVNHFRKVVKEECPRSLSSFDFSMLLVYKNKAAFVAKESSLKFSDSLKGLGEDESDNYLIVVVPSLTVAPLTQQQVDLPFSDGIDPSRIYFDRQAILDKMHKWITFVDGRNRFLLLCSPAASGKTSLLLLFQHMYQNENLVVHYVSLNVGADPWDYLIKFGLDFYNQSCQYTNVIYLLDDAQRKYENQQFWSTLIKTLPLSFGGGVRFIIAATHTISSGVDVSPPYFRLLEKIGRDDLLLSPDQSMLLLNSPPPLGFHSNFCNYDKLKKTIAEHCNGLIGALCKSILFYGDQIHYGMPTEVHCLHLFYSSTFLETVDRCFGVVDSSYITPEANNILLQLVLGQPINYIIDVRLRDILVSFSNAGFLIFDESNFIFSSLLAKRYYTNRYFPYRSQTEPLDLRELVMKTIESMSASSLKISTSNVVDFPKETTFQLLFMFGLLWNTTHNTVICSELSRSSFASSVKGEIDFFVDGKYIELVCSGVGEHVSNFTPNGNYSSGLEVIDYIVVDFCRGTTNVHQDSHRATVSFKAAADGGTCFKNATVKYGTNEPVDMKLQP